MNLFINRCPPSALTANFGSVSVWHVKKENASHPVNIRHSKTSLLKGAVSRNSAKLGNYKMPVKVGET